MENEQSDCISFLDVQIARRVDGSVQRSVCRKSTWIGQHLNFPSFVLIQYKRGLVRTPFHRARSICSEDKLKAELEKLYKTLGDNGCPKGVINMHRKSPDKAQEILTVPKLDVYLK
jgi:hypothetical protein